ncbi:MAG: universal stress protein [Gammaproteobacteria bacterium]|nr:universal stress protein [Gammaproteobacteria bacterium]MBT8125068.1 universal stress protein [Gammaproteobacteria bacterium]NNC68033.1 universal stress protein [Gammaproteobacteria bacterium]
MSEYKHILFATDFTSLSMNIAPKVKKLAELYGAKISLITVLEETSIYGYPGISEKDSSVSEQVQNAMVEFADKIQVPRERQYIEFGSVKGKVLAYAKSINADLIVVGSHGRHGLARLLGSSANAIVNGAECDVLLLRASE